MTPLLLLAACAKSPPAPTETQEPPLATGAHFLLDDVRLPGGQAVTIEVSDGAIVALDPEQSDAEVVDGGGGYVVPAFIDSHVHLAYYDAADELARNGVAAAVDLAAPESFLAEDLPIRVLQSGPMVTAVGGYPTRSWGSGGYGIECADADAAVAAVERLHAAGAEVIKLPVTGSAQLDDEALAAAADRAHALGLPVASHALGEDEAARARAAGADLLAHTPTQALSEGTVTAWADGGVITTVRAFGGGADAVENLQRLHQAGATVLYGTDLGNTRTAAIDASEIEHLLAAGMSPADVLAAGTSTPAEYWGLDTLGDLAPGKAASLLLVDTDPLDDPTVLAEPRAVWLDGVVMPR